ncbi:hypothetical protein ACFQ0T_39405 [Kitasatospora gansuensis]
MPVNEKGKHPMTEPAPWSVWTRPRPEPARRAPGVDQYVAAALAVADAEGLAAVSMRRVAAISAPARPPSTATSPTATSWWT